MSFDATARVAPEKQDMPACLPLVSSMGDERASMKHKTSTGLTATFIQRGDYGQPFVALANVPGIPEGGTYNAAQFLDAAARGEGFIVGPVWDDQEPFEIDASDVAAIAAMVRKHCDPRNGHFEMRWVARDPSTPF